MTEFCHLHVHTEYSLLDGAARINDLLDHCKALGMDSLAITDHGAMYGVVEFYKQAKNRGIHPVIGCEVYVAPRSMEDKSGSADKEYAHLVLLAENQTGYQNLVKLVSMGFTKGFYYKPRIDYMSLEQHSEGLIALSACLAGDIPRYLLNGQREQAKTMARRLADIFPGRFYIELQDHALAEQKQVLPMLIALARELELPLVATNDVHYIHKKDAAAHEVLLCIQTGKTMLDEDRMRFETNEFYLKPAQEMAALFASLPEAIENTVRIARRCQVDFRFDQIHLPQYPLESGVDHHVFFKKKCMEGLARKVDHIGPQMQERLDYELEVIIRMGYVDYFLIVWDFIAYAKNHGIMVGPGRGSGAGSLVAYSLDITDVNPLTYQLLFERFLNPERISMPDIDVDFCPERRQEVIDYVIGKYGQDHVAQIITFGTMAARAAVRDTGRGLGMPYAQVDRVAKLIPLELNITLEKAIAVSAPLREAMADDEQVQKLITVARTLEGLPRHASTHAAGVVISSFPLTDYVPLQTNDGNITTQFSMKIIEQLGLLKMDFLGLRNLTVIKDTLDIIAQNGEKVDLKDIDYSDQEVYRLISQGETDGVFQLESRGMRSFLKELQPDCFEDIIAGISLYRPGPMEQIPRYIAGKRNPRSVRYAHPMLEKILSVTNGCMVYQEQVMQIVRDMAGYSMARSDLVRRAMSKKQQDVMNKEKAIFLHGLEQDGQVIIPGAIRNGVPQQAADGIFNEMMAFAQYAFNKSHAAAYGVIAYQTAWLKTHHFVAFMAALLNSVMGNSAKIASYIYYCRKNGVEMLPLDINHSQSSFSVEETNIRFGMGAVKNVGYSAVVSLVSIRQEKGTFTDFADFLDKTNEDWINKRMVEGLIRAGAFDALGANRAQLLAVYEKMMEGIAQKRRGNIDGQINLFDLTADLSPMIEYPQKEEFPLAARLAMEKEMTGIYISGHPLDGYARALEGLDATSILEVDDEVQAQQSLDGRQVRMGGLVSAIQTKLTRSSNQTMAFVTLEDLEGEAELIVFASAYSRYARLLIPEAAIWVSGRISQREDENPKILVDTIQPLEPDQKPEDTPVHRPTSQKLYIQFNPLQGDQEWQLVMSLLAQWPGDVPVYLFFQKDNKTFLTDKSYWITASPALIERLSALMGNNSVRLVEANMSKERAGM